jgi:hypothetical protein
MSVCHVAVTTIGTFLTELRVLPRNNICLTAVLVIKTTGKSYTSKREIRPNDLPTSYAVLHTALQKSIRGEGNSIHITGVTVARIDGVKLISK